MATMLPIVFSIAVTVPLIWARDTNPVSSALANARGRLPECSLPPDAGECTGEFFRYYYDAMTRSCKPLYYGGCGGNANRFTSEKACLEVCSPNDATVDNAKVLSAKRYYIVPKNGAYPSDMGGHQVPLIVRPGGKMSGYSRMYGSGIMMNDPIIDTVNDDDDLTTVAGQSVTAAPAKKKAKAKLKLTIHKHTYINMAGGSSGRSGCSGCGGGCFQGCGGGGGGGGGCSGGGCGGGGGQSMAGGMSIPSGMQSGWVPMGRK